MIVIYISLRENIFLEVFIKFVFLDVLRPILAPEAPNIFSNGQFCIDLEIKILSINT